MELFALKKGPPVSTVDWLWVLSDHHLPVEPLRQ